MKTVDDFGVQGEYPSHPELLDYLAVEFRDGDGKSGPFSTKHLMTLIVTSATYRQSSTGRADLAAKDPDDRLLARFPRQRLSAEEIRDQALFAAGLLSPKLGGPPVFPVPAGRAVGRAIERRQQYQSLQAQPRRIALSPQFIHVLEADLPAAGDDRLRCSRSPQLHGASRGIDEYAVAGPGHVERRAISGVLQAARGPCIARREGDPRADDAAVRRATGRTPTEADLQTLEKGLAALLTRYRAVPADAEALLRQGATAAPAQLDKPELAAWMLVANAVLNLDATLVRD